MKKLIASGLVATVLFAAPATGAQAATTKVARAENVDLLSGRSRLFVTDSPLERVAISNPKVADVRVISNRQLMFQGLASGTTTVIVWTERGGAKSYEVTVGLDAKTVEKQVRDITANPGLNVAYNGSHFLVSGLATSGAQREMAEKIVQSFGQPTVNLVQLPQQLDQIRVDVQVVELSKTGALQLGWTPGGGETVGNTAGTRQFVFKPGQVLMGEATPGNLASFGQIDFLAAQIEALQERGQAKLLARPTLVTTDGGTAKFLVGGEIPIPIQQALGTTTIQWKEFGIRLEVAPTITPSGRIAMKVAPEVSMLDFANGLRMANFTVPALKSRRTETSVVLAPTETLMLGGLMNQDRDMNFRGLPFLADIPVLGALFRSTEWLENKTELAIFVTPRLVRPSASRQAPGNLPEVERELENGK